MENSFSFCLLHLTYFLVLCSTLSSSTTVTIQPSPSATAQASSAQASSAQASSASLGAVNSSIAVSTAASQVKQSVAPSPVPSSPPKQTKGNSDDDDDDSEDNKEFIALVTGCSVGGFFAIVGTIVVTVMHLKMDDEEGTADGTEVMSSSNGHPVTANGIKLDSYRRTDNEGLQMDLNS